jgi:hypothetical protein
MRIEVRCLTLGRYETAIAENDLVATFKLRTHYSVAEVDAAIRSEIRRANAWSSVSLPIVVEGPAGSPDEIPQELRDVLLLITAEADSKGSSSR